ncbi:MULTISPECIES: single-stranded DNA-binding protein [Sphingobium]|jgi:single-strand DNA-binding protein|uniref:Single-stranded DNA-binding protein n=2 Tax=Sphingobium yanoikuyae TaxID=13690 RepID=K9CQL0_SPHYA|nr:MULTISPECIES: single-stranded DNA-binding protein [Sphingobium]EKU74253.1 single-strand binding protein [Sphingobium yanoikuyae ATCC 51230]PHP21301.1 single-stranded DNA-binding protein [Sphingobium sp. IP1]RSU56152.1 single-stranded DNA-binding protein [Sphingobium yanoikuyae]WQE06189.1 single-stranded DNA-binding protein [Sphingobium yanoikuyae]SHM50903.1 single-strand binding protein [Sphingobium sp. YR657]
MAGSVNKVILIGNLGADPEVKSFQNGGKICNLRIATSESWKDRMSGERKERTEWHSVVINSEGLVGVAERFLRKGSKIYIEGQLRTRKWQDNNGNDRYTTEVALSGPGAVLTMLDGAPGGGGGQGGGYGGGRSSGGGNQGVSDWGASSGGFGGGDYDDFGGGNSGGGFGGGRSSGGGNQGGGFGGGRSSGGGQGGPNFDNDLDDEVPF